MSTSTTAREATAKRPHLLYVDDDQSNHVVLEQRLEEHYEIVSAFTDEEACRLLRAQSFDVVLMDIQLMGSTLDGIDLVRLMRGVLGRTTLPEYARDMPLVTAPVLFVTAFGESYSTEKLLEAGASGVIAKPVNFVKLSAAIARHLVRTMLPADS